MKKHLERLAADRRFETETNETQDLGNAPKHTVLSTTGLTSPVWTIGMFQMVSGQSCQYIKRMAQCLDADLSSAHVQSGAVRCFKS